jgi:hypothetical protein
MDHAQLHLRRWPGGPDGVGQAFEAVAADDEAIGDIPVAQLGEHAHPELGTLPTAGSDPHAQHVTLALQVDAHGHIDGPVGHLPFPDLHVDGVDQQHRVDPAVSVGARERECLIVSEKACQNFLGRPIAEDQPGSLIQLVGDAVEGRLVVR